MKAIVKIEGRRILVRSDLGFKDACKSAPTRRWNEAARSWEFEATPWVAHRLGLALEAVEGGAVEYSREFEVLRSQAIPVLSLIDSVVSSDGYAIHKPRRSRFVPWRHQYLGATLIRSVRSVYLAFDMGTGKTKTTIDAIVSLSEGASVFYPVLIVAPASVVSVWESEFPKHVADLDGIEVVASRQKDTVAKRLAAAREVYERRRRIGGVAVVVTNYESFFLDSSPFLKWAGSVPWEMLVADEAHRLSTPGSKTTKALGTLSKDARKIVFLSGTPMRNSPLDLYSQCKILDAGVFGSNQREFLERYAQLDFWGNVVGLNNTEELSQSFGVLAYRVDKRQVLDLPPVTIQTRRVTLSAEGRRAYEELEENLVLELERGTVEVANAIVQLLRLQQITSGFLPVTNEAGTESIQTIDTEKTTELADVVESISKDEPIVVFCRFRHDLDTVRLVAKHHGRASFELSGRENTLKEWQADTTGSVIAVQIQAGGIGVDLTRSSTTVFYSVGFSLADYQQATARVDRPGQTRPVTLINLLATNTVDEAIFGTIEKKGDVVEGVLEYLRGKKGKA